MGQPEPVSHGDGKRRLSGLRLLAVALGIVLFVQALFVLSYVGALHDPKPHEVAIGVIGTSPLATVVGKQFSLDTTAYPSESAAVTAIDQREIDGALVGSPTGSKLIVVPAAGSGGAAALSAAFTAAAAALGQKLEVAQVHPLPSRDASGAVPFFVDGTHRRRLPVFDDRPGFRRAGHRRRRLTSLALASAIGALLTDTLAGHVLGVPTEVPRAVGDLHIVVMAVAFAAAASFKPSSARRARWSS
jgi:hypothetical protein